MLAWLARVLSLPPALLVASLRVALLALLVVLSHATTMLLLLVLVLVLVLVARGARVSGVAIRHVALHE